MPIHIIIFIAASYSCKIVRVQLTQKIFRMLSLQPGLRGSNDLRVRRKMAIFQLFFSVQRTGGIPTGPDPKIRVGD